MRGESAGFSPAPLQRNQVLRTNSRPFTPAEVAPIAPSETVTTHGSFQSTTEHRRAEIPPVDSISSVDDEYHSSPNDEWIFGVRGVAHGFSKGDLFHRVDSQHIEFAPTNEEQSFNSRIWPFCVKQGALKANYSLEEAEADVGQTTFVAWNLDSGRLLVQLRGGNRRKMLQSCYVYFNTRTKNFEITDYLRKLNKTKSESLACAEPTDPLPSEAELKTRFDKLDQQLNKAYGERVAKTEKDRVSILRNSQREWLKHRDEGVKIYLSVTPTAEKERRRLQFLGDVTAARLDDFNRPADEDI